MKKFYFNLFFIFLALLMTSCMFNESIYSKKFQEINEGRDGLSIEKAIIILRNNERTGISDEYDYIRTYYPKSKMLSQALTSEGNKYYDVLSLKLEDGKEIQIYFDITHFFGKF